MLAIRMQRTGRKGHAMFRVIVQESRLTPTSGRIVAQLGYYDPHTKAVTLEKEKASFYLDHGAQPSDRVARLMQKEGLKLPEWVSVGEVKGRTTRHPAKLRKNRPAGEAAPEETAPAAEAPVDEAPVSDEVAPEAAEVVAEETSEVPAETAEPTEE